MNKQLEVKVENDKFAGEDRYYSSGLFIGFKKQLKNNFLFQKKPNNTIIIGIQIGNEVYTPTNLSSFDIRDFDRPFAGWLFGKFEVGKISEQKASFLSFETGITGDESLSGRLQIWFHDFIGLEDFTTWAEQIEFKWLFNLKYKYIYNWHLSNSQALQYELLPSLGTKDIFLENSFHYFIGKFNSLENSSRIGAIDNFRKKEFFGLISLGYKYVVHNTLIEGSIFKEDVLFTTEATPHIFKMKAGVVLKYQRNTFKLIYNFNSKESPLSAPHYYGTFSYSINF